MVERAILIIGVFGILYGIIIALEIAVEISAAKDFSEHSFSCPNCGKKVDLHWKQIFKSRFFSRNPIYLRSKCPNCQKTDYLKSHRPW